MSAPGRPPATRKLVARSSIGNNEILVGLGLADGLKMPRCRLIEEKKTQSWYDHFLKGLRFGD